MFEITVKGGKISISIINVLKRCDKEETRKTFEAYERYIVKVLSKKGDKIIVDWPMLEKVLEIADYRTCEAIRQYINAVLLSLKILTKDPRGAYSFSEDSMNLIWGMPGSDYSSYGIGTLYFKRKEDIVSYGRARYSGRIGNWLIFRMSEVILKQEICK
jgi:hypothetical protein